VPRGDIHCIKPTTLKATTGLSKPLSLNHSTAYRLKQDRRVGEMLVRVVLEWVWLLSQSSCALF